MSGSETASNFQKARRSQWQGRAQDSRPHRLSDGHSPHLREHPTSHTPQISVRRVCPSTLHKGLVVGAVIHQPFSFLLWPLRVACGILLPPPGIEPVSSALGEQSLTHWAALHQSFSVCVFRPLGPAVYTSPGVSSRDAQATSEEKQTHLLGFRSHLRTQTSQRGDPASKNAETRIYFPTLPGAGGKEGCLHIMPCMEVEH